MNIFGKVKNKIKSVKDLRTTAKAPQHNDFYVVEFPKSGITWLSSLLANAALVESGRPEVASFTAAQQFVPDIHVTRHIAQMPYDKPPVRFIKSHAAFNRNYIFVIYLVRHPVNVMKSYYRFNREIYGDIFGSFSEFCKSEKYGIPSWKSHVNSWLTGRAIAQRLHLVRYEDLMKDPEYELSLISRSFGWNLGVKSIQRAVALSSIENMKTSEELYQSRNPRYSIRFVGGVNDFEVLQEDVSLIQGSCEKELMLLGYND